MLNNWSSRRPGVRTLAAAASFGAGVALVLPATASAAPGIEGSVQGSVDSGSATINGSVGDIVGGLRRRRNHQHQARARPRRPDVFRTRLRDRGHPGPDRGVLRRTIDPQHRIHRRRHQRGNRFSGRQRARRRGLVRPGPRYRPRPQRGLTPFAAPAPDSCPDPREEDRASFGHFGRTRHAQFSPEFPAARHLPRECARRGTR